MPPWGPDAWADLARLFMPEYGYKGFKPDVAEAPNGDTKVCPKCRGGGELKRSCADYQSCDECHGAGCMPNVDAGCAGKRYLHVALKYNPPEWAIQYLARAHYKACRIAERLKVPAAFYPRAEFGALRVLEYPSAGHRYANDNPYNCDNGCGHIWHALQHGDELVCPALAAGAGTAEHCDFDLFTVNLWRSMPEDHECATSPGSVHEGEWIRGASPWHMGEIGELVGLGPAIKHRVPARPYVQRALVYFAIPDHAAVLPTVHTCGAGTPAGCRCRGASVGEWLNERMARSRVSKGSY